MSLPAPVNIDFAKMHFFCVGEIASLIFLMNLGNEHSHRTYPHAYPHGTCNRFYYAGRSALEKARNCYVSTYPHAYPHALPAPPHNPYRRGFATAPILGRPLRRPASLRSALGSLYLAPTPRPAGYFFLGRPNRPARAAHFWAFLSTGISATLVCHRDGFAAWRTRPNEY